MNQNFQNPPFNMNPQNNYPNQSFVLNLNANPFLAQKSQKKNTSPQNNINYRNQSNRIKEVYSDNFIQEIKNISNYLNQYPYVGMDTEFPGVIYPCPVATENFLLRLY